jgi:hypothetical protein
MNSITRKVEFLNTKNHLLSDENTMNLLINEEEFLNDKLNNILRDNYTIKKFSKSIYDENNGNKYLLPLFNNTDKIFLTSQSQNNKAKIKQTKEYYNKCFSIDDLMERNKSKDYNKKIIRIFSKKKINGKEKKKLKITYFPSNPESTVPEVENYKRITLSYDKKNIINKENICFTFNSKLNYGKNNEKKNNALSLDNHQYKNYNKLIFKHKKTSDYGNIFNNFIPSTKIGEKNIEEKKNNIK